MLPLADFFHTHIIEIYFVYGLGFFIMGLAVALESGHASALPLARAVPWLAGFGLTHAAAEWADMLIEIGELTGRGPISATSETIAVGIEYLSFLFLLRFGCELMRRRQPVARCRLPVVIPITLVIYLIGLAIISVNIPPGSRLWVKTADVWSSYAGGVPAFVFTVWGLVLHSRQSKQSDIPQLSGDLRGAAIAFSWYAVFDSVFVPQLPYFPASVINASLFLNLVGLPIQLVRAITALVISFFFLRALRLFAAEDRGRLEEALETQRRLQASSERLNQELRAAAKEMSALYEQIRQSDEVHRYLLKRVVQAQEEERRRVARDLHDGVGQALSGLAAGLAALEARCQSQDTSIHEQIENMKQYSLQSLDELHRVVTDLRPSVLDELGLMAALRWYARHYAETLPLIVDVVVQGQIPRLPQEAEIVLFRIAQEALTNVVKHARANKTTVTLSLESGYIVLKVSDDGIGFDPEATFAETGEHRPWGLLGMQERAALVGGTVSIESKRWQGTTVTARIPLPTMEAGSAHTCASS